uniref:Cytochrome c oxidase subunit 2 n=1 Tax=Pseudocellus gertschi TaxID=1329481 RepID=W5R4I4_9ARAC|nr:cytochrome c oxidase subunit II [Pseudocellus gertschi]AGL11934.1 cytochrome c oxidase subunit II [Pseudocellus gertschi]
MPTWNISLQNSNSPLMEQLTFFHDHTMMILILITIIVGYIMLNSTMNSMSNRFLLQGQEIELIWTILPAIILISIAFPSLRLLYLMDESFNPLMTIKISGHQWYWSYEYPDFSPQEIESYMLPLSDSQQFRLLDVDNRTVVPNNTQIRMLVTSSDVIHSWTIPALGVKVDAVPGRLNQLITLTKRPSIMFGQCSEICGANHSFMPIVMESVNIKNFIKWIIKL